MTTYEVAVIRRFSKNFLCSQYTGNGEFKVTVVIWEGNDWEERDFTSFPECLDCIIGNIGNAEALKQLATRG